MHLLFHARDLLKNIVDESKRQTKVDLNFDTVLKVLFNLVNNSHLHAYRDYDFRFLKQEATETHKHFQAGPNRIIRSVVRILSPVMTLIEPHCLF